MHAFFGRQSRARLVLMTLGCVAVLGVLDYITGFEASFVLFYLFPVALVAWFVGRRGGLLLSLASAITGQGANILAGETFTSLAIPFWNTATRLGFFLVVTALLARLRRALEHERNLVRTDFLTGALNRRAFYETAEAELLRLRRYGRPCTVIYFDADNFKVVNDRHGHLSGDALLKTVAATISSHLRQADYIARLGGDEFAALLPETGDDAAQVVAAKLHEVLTGEMQRNGWPVTFSLGMLTCTAAPASVDDLIRRADALMYAAKNGGKNGIKSAVYNG